MRPFLIWRDDWLLGCELLDEQHLALAGMLNDLHRFLCVKHAGSPDRKHQLCRRLALLLETTKRHFADEEALMLSRGYPGLSRHHREHALLLAEMQECIRDIESGSRNFTLATLSALKFWQIDHVLNSDREFADFLEQRSSIPSAADHSLWSRTADTPRPFPPDRP